MRYGVSVPNVAAYADPHRLVELARVAEAAGWDGFFVWDHMLLNQERPPAAVDPWVVLAAVAAVTERITLGPMVTPLARRRPWKVARESTTLDHLSGGRTVLGVGLGTPAEAEFGVFGEPTDARVRAAMLDEALAVVSGLWSGQAVRYDGAYYRHAPVAFQPAPLRGRIPVWVAGRWPNQRPFQRAARWDGAVAMKAGEAYHETLPPADIARIAGMVAGGDVVVCAASSWVDAPPPPAPVRDYQEAGATWWLEVLHPREPDPDELRARIAHGPGVLTSRT
ncbi:MAG TPA: LLM class flavin-dependent oxidoreductase [Micromonosporaceae bacterium]|nr:LLM class flavin-dependent oxidoreductase [Micromonosporaceae bacterium]